MRDRKRGGQPAMPELPVLARFIGTIEQAVLAHIADTRRHYESAYYALARAAQLEKIANDASQWTATFITEHVADDGLRSELLRVKAELHKLQELHSDARMEIEQLTAWRYANQDDARMVTRGGDN